MIKSILKKIYVEISQNPVILVILLYILSILLVSPWSDIAINDDFYYMTQVKAFSMGIFTKSALVTPNFILQGFMGFLWGSVFGVNYISMRVLTILLSILSIIGVSKILTLFNVRKSIKITTLLLIAFNPYFYASSLSFMTENYFLVFIIWSLYFFLSYTKFKSLKNLLLASILGGLSIMVRQYGVVLLISYLTVLIARTLFILNTRKLPKDRLIEIIYLLLPFLILGFLGFFWPQYKNPVSPTSIDDSFFFTSIESALSRLKSLRTIPYITFMLIPFTLASFVRKGLKTKFVVLFLSIPLAYVFFRMNIFKMGNMFYVEGLYAKMYLSIRETIFNNIFFKLFLSYVISLSTTVLSLFILKYLFKSVLSLKKRSSTLLVLKNIFVSDTLVFYILLIGFYLITLISAKIFDRYLINFFITLVILGSIKANDFNLDSKKIMYASIACIALMTILLSIDYYNKTDLKWEFADKLSNEFNVARYDILLDQVYARDAYVYKKKNYKGFGSIMSEEYSPICYVVDYEIQNPNKVYDLMTYIRDRSIVKKYFNNPKIIEASLLKPLKNNFDSSDILFFDKEYKSPIFNLLGKRVFVRAYCLSNYKDL